MVTVGISGLAGSGKDTVADMMVQNQGFVKVAFADPLKRICKDVYDFTDEQLWGPSEKRNEPDERYPRDHNLSYGYVEKAPELMEFKCNCCGATGEFHGSLSDVEAGKLLGPCYLTPRYALKLLGTEWGRHCYDLTWVDYAIRTARDLLDEDRTARDNHYAFLYTAQDGLRSVEGVTTYRPPNGVAIPDVRFKNEIKGIREAGGLVVRVRRKGYEKPAFDHPSETEQMRIPDEEFDHVISNVGTLEDLQVKVADFCMRVCGPAVVAEEVDLRPQRLSELLEARDRDVAAGKISPYSGEQVDIPPFKRK